MPRGEGGSQKAAVILKFEVSLAHKLTGILFFEFFHENWWKGVLLYQTIRAKAIVFFLAHC